jgi:hypothetical protein
MNHTPWASRVVVTVDALGDVSLLEQPETITTKKINNISQRGYDLFN